MIKNARTSSWRNSHHILRLHLSSYQYARMPSSWIYTRLSCLKDKYTHLIIQYQYLLLLALFAAVQASNTGYYLSCCKTEANQVKGVTFGYTQSCCGVGEGGDFYGKYVSFRLRFSAVLCRDSAELIYHSASTPA